MANTDNVEKSTLYGTSFLDTGVELQRGDGKNNKNLVASSGACPKFS